MRKRTMGTEVQKQKKKNEERGTNNEKQKTKNEKRKTKNEKRETRNEERGTRNEERGTTDKNIQNMLSVDVWSTLRVHSGLFGISFSTFRKFLHVFLTIHRGCLRPPSVLR